MKTKQKFENRTINLVRIIPQKLHTALKMLAAKQKTSLQAVCLVALENHISNQKK